MKTHHTRRVVRQKLNPNSKRVPWRDVFKKEIAKYGEEGLALRGARSRAGWTQKELANKMKISQHHVSEMENGKRPIGKAMAKRFSKVFKIDYRVFL